jgi:hypothetical protein
VLHRIGGLFVSSIGYPDFQSPRDWLSGLNPEQQLASVYVGFPTAFSAIYTVPAGKHVALTYVRMGCALVGNGVAPYSNLFAVLHLSNGIDGTGADINFLDVLLDCQPTTEANGEATRERPLVIGGGGGGNILYVAGTTINATIAEGTVYVYGSLLD